MTVRLRGSDPEGAPVRYILGKARGHRVQLLADGRVRVVPRPGYSGPLRFGYTARDASGARDSAQVVVRVR